MKIYCFRGEIVEALCFASRLGFWVNGRGLEGRKRLRDLETTARTAGCWLVGKTVLQGNVIILLSTKRCNCLCCFVSFEIVVLASINTQAITFHEMFYELETFYTATIHSTTYMWNKDINFLCHALIFIFPFRPTLFKKILFYVNS